MNAGILHGCSSACGVAGCFGAWIFGCVVTCTPWRPLWNRRAPRGSVGSQTAPTNICSRVLVYWPSHAPRLPCIAMKLLGTFVKKRCSENAVGGISNEEREVSDLCASPQMIYASAPLVTARGCQRYRPSCPTRSGCSASQLLPSGTFTWVSEAIPVQ